MDNFKSSKGKNKKILRIHRQSAEKNTLFRTYPRICPQDCVYVDKTMHICECYKKIKDLQRRGIFKTEKEVLCTQVFN